MQSPTPLIIVGAGGFGREAAWMARARPEKWDLRGFLDDDDRLQGTLVCNAPVLGKISDWTKHHDSHFITAIGSPRLRKAIVEEMSRNGDVKFATLVDPSVLRSEFVTIGEGTIVSAGSIITTQATVGRHCAINLGVTVSHDVTLGDYCTLAPQVALTGNVSAGRGVELGTAAVVVPGVAIGEGSMVCAGATVTRPIPPNTLVAGSPARRVKGLTPFS